MIDNYQTYFITITSLEKKDISLSTGISGSRDPAVGEIWRNPFSALLDVLMKFMGLLTNEKLSIFQFRD